MGYSDRSRKRARRKPFKKPLPKILIVCEGEASEPEYFRGLKATLQNPRVDIEIGKEHGVPLTLVQYAAKLKRQAHRKAKAAGDTYLAYNAVWCVFDIDEHPNIPDACECARDNKIDCAISNPSFELWLLLHFREPPGASHRDKVKEMLSKFDPEYDKHIEFSKYQAGRTNAAQRADRLEKLANSTSTLLRDQNPSTSVYRLTKLIEGEIKH